MFVLFQSLPARFLMPRARSWCLTTAAELLAHEQVEDEPDGGCLCIDDNLSSFLGVAERDASTENMPLAAISARFVCTFLLTKSSGAERDAAQNSEPGVALDGLQLANGTTQLLASRGRRRRVRAAYPHPPILDEQRAGYADEMVRTGTVAVPPDIRSMMTAIARSRRAGERAASAS
jgi:hypothetical protein